MNILNNSLYTSFNIDKSDWVFLSIQVTLSGYTARTAFSLKRWDLKVEVKSWAIKLRVGPLSLNLVNEHKLEAFIQKVLSENEDSFQSES